MRVDNSSIVNQAGAIKAKKVYGVEEAAGASTDSVQLSSRAADIRTAMEALASAPDVREDRVAEISRQLEQGTLATDGGSLAQKLLQGQ